jgi:hypothetical protein
LLALVWVKWGKSKIFAHQQQNKNNDCCTTKRANGVTVAPGSGCGVFGMYLGSFAHPYFEANSTKIVAISGSQQSQQSITCTAIEHFQQ